MNAVTFATDECRRERRECRESWEAVGEADKKSGVPESVNCIRGNAVLFIFVGSLDLDLDITRTVHHPTLPMSQPNWNRPQHPSKHPQRVDEPPASQHRAYPAPVGVGLIDEQLTNIRSQFEHILQQNHLLKVANDDLEAKCAYDIVQFNFFFLSAEHWNVYKF